MSATAVSFFKSFKNTSQQPKSPSADDGEDVLRVRHGVSLSHKDGNLGVNTDESGERHANAVSPTDRDTFHMISLISGISRTK